MSDDIKIRPSGKKVASNSSSGSWWLVFLFLLAVMIFNLCWFIAASWASESNIVQLNKNNSNWSESVLPAKKEALSSAAGLSAMEVLFAPIERVSGRQMSAGTIIPVFRRRNGFSSR